MIHKTAVIDENAELGRDVTVGPFAYIAGKVKIGDGCVIGPHVSVLDYTSIDRNCMIHSGAVIGDLPQDTGFKGVESYVNVGADCVIREGVTIHRGSKEGTVTEIGHNCFLMAFSHFAHNVKLGNNVIVANGALLAGYVEVGDKAFISGNVGIHQFVRIGKLVMLGGGAGLSKDVPPFCTVRPISFNTVVGLNVVGMRRAGISPEDRTEIKRAYKTLYHSGLNVTQAVRELKSLFHSEVALEFIDFIERSKRGLCGCQSDQNEEG